MVNQFNSTTCCLSCDNW